MWSRKTNVINGKKVEIEAGGGGQYSVALEKSGYSWCKRPTILRNLDRTGYMGTQVRNVDCVSEAVGQFLIVRKPALKWLKQGMVSFAYWKKCVLPSVERLC